LKGQITQVLQQINENGGGEEEEETKEGERKLLLIKRDKAKYQPNKTCGL
jgi:hypothetical protein